MPTVTGYATDFITFSRASNATVTGSDGKIKWAAHNLLLASEQFDASSWSRQGLSGVTANAIAAPNGTTTADKLLENNLNDFHYVAQLNVIDDGAPVSTFSVFARAAERQYLNLSLSWGSNWVAATFDLTGGTVTSDRSGGTGASQSSSITSVGGGWYLCTLRGTIGTGGSDAAVIAISNTATPTGVYPIYNGTTGNGLHLWGAHLYRSDLGGMVANTSAYPYYNPTTPKNLLGYTEDFSNAYWTKTATTVTANAIVAPNGLQTADKLVASTAATYHNIFRTVTITGPSVISIYAKAAEYQLLRIADWNNGAIYASFNLATGAVVAGTTGGIAFGSASITAVGDGWYRCAIITTTSASAVYSFNFSPYPAGATIDFYGASYTGDGTSGIYLWGAQLSDSASLDTYVPVYGAAVTSAAYYGPRLDYDPSTLAAKGLLVEEQRTNLLTYSAEFDNAAWTKGNVTVTANAVASPDGTTTADKLLETATTTSHAAYRTVSASAAAHTFSVYLKAAERSYAALGFTDGGTDYSCRVNLSSGAITLTDAGVTGVVSNAGNGWYRLSITRTLANASVNVFIATADTATGSLIYLGVATSGIYIWGAQLEAGSFATSYIPTTSATVTRSADVAQVSTQAFPYSQTEGTLVANVVASTGSYGSYMSDGTANNYILTRSAGSGVAASVVAGGVLQANLGTSALSGKIGVVYKLDDFAVSVNGGAAATDTSGSVPTGITQLRLGAAHDGGANINGHIRQITYIPRRLTNAELQSRTT